MNVGLGGICTKMRLIMWYNVEIVNLDVQYALMKSMMTPLTLFAQLVSTKPIHLFSKECASAVILPIFFILMASVVHARFLVVLNVSHLLIARFVKIQMPL